MKVADLIAELQKLPADAVVNITTEMHAFGESVLSYDEIGSDDIVLNDEKTEVFLG